MRAEISLKRSSSSWIGCTAVRRFSRTVLSSSSSGSWATYRTRIPLASVAVPSMSLSMPAMIRNSVDLPDPFSPTTPIFAP